MPASLFRPLTNLIGRSTLVRLLLVMLLFVAAGMLGLYLFERDHNPAYDTPGGALWAMVVFLFSGFDYELPMTLGGRITAVLVVAGGVGLLGLFTAAVTTFLVDLHRRRRHGMIPVKFKGHYIVCGWNPKGPEIIAQLTADAVGRKLDVALVAQLEESPIEHDRVQFVRGEPTDERVLGRAAVADASCGIILPQEGVADADGHSLLVTLALRSLNPTMYICIEVINAQHVIHLKRAGASEIISSTELAANMLSQAAITHGVTRLYDQILSNRYGHEVYKTPVPATVAGKTVAEAVPILAVSRPVTLLAVGRGDELLVNPERDLAIEADDHLLLLAERYPSHLFE